MTHCVKNSKALITSPKWLGKLSRRQDLVSEVRSPIVQPALWMSFYLSAREYVRATYRPVYYVDLMVVILLSQALGFDISVFDSVSLYRCEAYSLPTVKHALGPHEATSQALQFVHGHSPSFSQQGHHQRSTGHRSLTQIIWEVRSVNLNINTVCPCCTYIPTDFRVIDKWLLGGVGGTWTAFKMILSVNLNLTTKQRSEARNPTVTE